MDDKETKNIDGIKPPEAVNDSTEKIVVNVNEQDASDTATDVEISTDGDIAVQQESEPVAEEVPAAPVAEASPTPEDADAEKEVPKEISVDDPGIVPSVQPAAAVAASPATEVARLKERVKHLKIWLVVLMLLLVAVASALVVYFASQTKAKNDLKAQQQANAQLQTELAEAQQGESVRLAEELDAEKTKNAVLQATIDEQTQQIKEYQTTIVELQKACGSACSSVDVPEDTTNSNTTN